VLHGFLLGGWRAADPAWPARGGGGLVTVPLRFTMVSKWYGPVIGLSEVSFELKPGVTGLLGKNGSGKSTLIKLACGLLEPSLGDVQVFDAAPARSTTARARIGLVPDVDRFYEAMTARQFITRMLRLSGFGAAEARQRAEQSLLRLGLQDALDRKIAGFSKGMRQRTKLAQAVAHDPDLLFLDEPLNGLDPIGRNAVIELVRELGNAGRSVLVSSHVLHEVEAMTPRILLIHQGRLLAEGTVKEIRTLLADRPSRVRVGCRDPRGIAARLVSLPSVRACALETTGLEVTVEHPIAFYQALTDLACDPAAGVLEVEALDDSLEAVFGYLVK
jgi:ABC-2 type transport system ATP-binding protein